MIPPTERGCSQYSISYVNTPIPSDRYLQETLDSFGSQSDWSTFAFGSAPKGFTDFILYESDVSDIQTDLMSNSRTSGSVRMDMSSDISRIPLFASSPNSVAVSIDTAVPNDTSSYRWPHSTELDEADYAAAFGCNMPNFQWNSPEPALNMSPNSHSECETGEDSEQSSPRHSMSAQNDTVGRLPVPRMRYFKCPECQSHYSSESRLSKHLHKSHAPPRFTCDICYRGFKQEKDLKRHQFIHEPSKRAFACSCTRTYARYDGLLRHFTTMATRPREAGHHKAVKSNPN